MKYKSTYKHHLVQQIKKNVIKQKTLIEGTLALENIITEMKPFSMNVVKFMHDEKH